MKTQIFPVLLFCSLLVGTLSYTWEAFELECIHELKLKKSTIESVNNVIQRESPEDNADLNKFLECSWKKDGTLNENGEVNWDKVKAKLLKKVPAGSYSVQTADVVKNAVKECQEKNLLGENPGQTVAKVQNCLGTYIKSKWEEFIKNLRRQ